LSRETQEIQTFNILEGTLNYISPEQTGRMNQGSETVQMIVTLAHSLGMDMVAEEIETAAELKTLRTLGCEFGQGYLFSPPVSAQRAGEWLKQ